MTNKNSQQKPQLKQKLTLFDMTMIAIGSTIGSGIFLTPSIITKALPSAKWIILVWIVGGLLSLSGALTFSELGSMMPKAGGVYVYLTRAYGGLFGFLYGWAYFLIVNTGAIAALAVAFSTYFAYFLPLSPAGIKIFAVCGIILVTVINVLGVKSGAIFSDLFTVLKLLGIAAVIIIGLGWGTAKTTDFSAPLPHLPHGLGSALALPMVGVLWSTGGWQHATFAAGEAKDARRTLPASMIIGTITVTAVYLLTNIAYMFLLSPSRIAVSERVAADAVEVVLGSAGGIIISLAIFISAFGTTGIYTLTAPRIYYAMASDGLFFRKVAEIHPKYHTPAFAIIFQSIWAIFLILFWGTFENLISYVVFTDWIFFALAAACVFVLRSRFPDAERPYRTLGYPLTPLFFIAISVWFVLNTLIEKPAQAWAGIGFLLIGVPVFYFWKNKYKSAH